MLNVCNRRRVFILAWAFIGFGAGDLAHSENPKKDGRSAPAAQETASAKAAELDSAIQNRDLPELQRRLASAKLGDSERKYFMGVLADRRNNPKRSIALLERVLPELRARNSHRAAAALRCLATDYFIVGRYHDAAAAYSELLEHFSLELSLAAKRLADDNLHTFELLSSAPPQRVAGAKSFHVPVRFNSLNVIEVPVAVGLSQEWWFFDTGANISTITQSTAKRLSLKISDKKASTRGSTAAEVPLQMAVIPELRFGQSVIHNVAALVVSDDSLNIDLGTNGRFQIEGILGFPVMQALGSFTLQGAEMSVAPESRPSHRSGDLYQEELMPLLDASFEGKHLLFEFDTGASNTQFTAKFLDRFTRQFTSPKQIQRATSGAGGVRVVPAYELPTVALEIGSAKAELHNTAALREDIGTDLLDAVYGIVGEDLLGEFQTITIDFRRMKFSVGETVHNSR